MIELFRKKLELVNDLKIYTNEIMLLSTKTDDKKISFMIEERQKYIETINIINHKIDKCLLSNVDDLKQVNEINNLKVSIRESIKEIINMDKEIRKNVSDELKIVKSKLNQPETKSKLVNIKI